MIPKQPDLARDLSQRGLSGQSDTESDEADEMEDQAPSPTNAPFGTNPAQSAPPDNQPEDLQQFAQKVLTNSANAPPPPKPLHRDSVVEVDDPKHSLLVLERRPSQASTLTILPNGAGLKSNGTSLAAPGSSTLSATSPDLPTPLQGTVTNGHPHRNSLATSPHLAQLTISQSRGSVTDTLPALQTQPTPRDGSVSSPGQQLPSFQHIDNIAQESNRVNPFAHRPSISSSIGQSPTTNIRQLSISSHSPATPFPTLSASSPISASSDLQRGDIFLRTSGGSVFGADARRPSQASEGGPYAPTLHSASTSESYQSSDGPSPGAAPTPIEGRPRHMSLDSTIAATRLLPLPHNSGIQHIPAHGAGSFKCDYQGCTAAPFQTQYLLNSHANVHSQSRPHYCPVIGCPRAEGGKGFKRKNEMIRHGLVHQSPGYVCPFCPDREHKYPRPDNLQRHVRVHHVDKDKDDAQLREVLAQRPEGGSRGRRRRVSDIS
ncbi:hypothetical protein BKA66DRAFT_564527 [Pyrenochaeta sp. MPI-SDFR-AT-0127]|nr:hypothetical protein BKA66DRAFT_564527 [Pyrenochaeta sp. MPI-SDFR-AT-0127]